MISFTQYLKEGRESTDLEESISVKALTTAAAIRLKKKLDNKWSSYDFNIDKTGLRLSVPNEKAVIRYIKKQPEVDTLEESVDLEEAFMRLPGNIINNELYAANRQLDELLKSQNAGNDFDAKRLNTIIKSLNDVKKSAKKFNNPKEVPLSFQYKKESTDLEEAKNWWTVTITKKAGKLFKGQTVDVKASNSAQAIKKGIKQMKGDPTTVPSGSVDAVLGESLEEAVESKQKVLKAMIRGGSNPKDAEALLKKHFSYVEKTYSGATPAKKAEIIVTLAGTAS